MPVLRFAPGAGRPSPSPSPTAIARIQLSSPVTTQTLLLLLLRERECALHRSDVRHDATRLADLIHAEFTEIGRSGTAYSRAEIVAALAAEQQCPRVHAQGFSVRELADGVALLNYKSAQMAASGEWGRHTLRSSIWVMNSGAWQLLFHQGTATAPFEPLAS